MHPDTQSTCHLRTLHVRVAHAEKDHAHTHLFDASQPLKRNGVDAGHDTSWHGYGAVDGVLYDLHDLLVNGKDKTLTRNSPLRVETY